MTVKFNSLLIVHSLCIIVVGGADGALEIFTNYYAKFQSIAPVKNLSGHLITEQKLTLKNRLFTKQLYNLKQLQ